MAAALQIENSAREVVLDYLETRVHYRADHQPGQPLQSVNFAREAGLDLCCCNFHDH